MKFNDLNEIERTGFIGFKKMSELFIDSSMLPASPGVYFVLNIDNKPPVFLPKGTGGYFKGKDPNVLIEVLEKDWVENTNVVYIGKATSLKKRLGDYLKFGQGRNIGHYGGRYIWQLKNSRDLVVCWKTLTTEEPRNFEAELIQLFRKKFDCRPFANLVD